MLGFVPESTTESRRADFLAESNTARLAKRLYQFHAKQGGTIPYATVLEQTRALQRKWGELPKLDSREPIARDPQADLRYVDDMFFETYRPMYEVAWEQRPPRQRLETVEDYRQMDVEHLETPFHNEPEVFEPRNTTNIREHVSRHTDRDLQRDRYPELASSGTRTAGVYDMRAVEQAADRPYARVDDYNAEYYGQPIDDGDLLSTRWKSE